ncbi:dihydrofolate reductase family protein [Pantanalinema rosaneae CENA516]|uniref:dihydrofolate reductase family protein n=1 Tax=Pantanalinema rosaneae TaxID=1620701 RepID=UPI003D6FBD12
MSERLESTDSLVRRAIPDDGATLRMDSADARPTLLDWYRPHSPEHVRLNLVSTLDGRAAGADGTSESLTSPTDRVILGVIRELGQVVVVGAESVRQERYLRPRRAALAIVTASGDLSGHRLSAGPEQLGATETNHPIIVLTTDHGAESARAQLPHARIMVLADDDVIPAHAIVMTLRQLGFAGITVEGGPTLAAHLLRVSVVDELCLTVMPRIGGPALPLLTGDVLREHSAVPHQLLLASDGTQFGRWQLQPGPSA